MACETLYLENGEAVFFCNSTDVVFGPVLRGGGDEALAFEKWLQRDPRDYEPDVLVSMHSKFLEEFGECDECGEWGRKGACEFCEAYNKEMSNAE